MNEQYPNTQNTSFQYYKLTAFAMDSIQIFGSLLQGEHYLGKREPEPAGRHTEGVWSPGRRKRSTQPGWMRKGGIPWNYNIKNLLASSTMWTPRPTSALHFTSLMDPSINMKRTELGPWGRLNKRNADQSSETHPLIRIIRASDHPKPWEELSGLGLSFTSDAWTPSLFKIQPPDLRPMHPARPLVRVLQEIFGSSSSSDTDPGHLVQVLPSPRSFRDSETRPLVRIQRSPDSSSSTDSETRPMIRILRSLGSGSSTDSKILSPESSTDSETRPLIRILRGSNGMERRIRKDKDENQWERVIKRAAEGNKGIKRAVAKKVLRAYGRLSKRDLGSGTKWGRVMKMAEDGEDEQFEEIEKRAGDVEDEDFEEDTQEEVFGQPLNDLGMIAYKL